MRRRIAVTLSAAVGVIIAATSAQAAQPPRPKAVAFRLIPVVCNQGGGTISSKFVLVKDMTMPTCNKKILALDINLRGGNGDGGCLGDLAGASITGVNGQPFTTLSYEIKGDISHTAGPNPNLVGVDSHGNFTLCALYSSFPDSSTSLVNGFTELKFSRSSFFFSPLDGGTMPVTLTNLYIAEGPTNETFIRNVKVNGVVVKEQLQQSLGCQGENFTSDPACPHGPASGASK